MRNSAFIGFFLGVWCSQALAATDVAAYQGCSQLVLKQPQEALAMAEQWIQQTPHPSAYHCRAMALFSLGRYEQAAGALEQLEQQLRNGNVLLWGNVVRQQARSWALASNPSRAISTLSEGIDRITDSALTDPSHARLCAELLFDRSQLYGAANSDNHLSALQDLDQAISLAPSHAPLLFARAQLLAQLGNNEMALRDLATLESLHPNYPQAAALTGKLRNL